MPSKLLNANDIIIATEKNLNKTRFHPFYSYKAGKKILNTEQLISKYHLLKTAINHEQEKFWNTWKQYFESIETSLKNEDYNQDDNLSIDFMLKQAKKMLDEFKDQNHPIKSNFIKIYQWLLEQKTALEKNHQLKANLNMSIAFNQQLLTKIENFKMTITTHEIATQQRLQQWFYRYLRTSESDNSRWFDLLAPTIRQINAEKEKTKILKTRENQQNFETELRNVTKESAKLKQYQESKLSILDSAYQAKLVEQEQIITKKSKQKFKTLISSIVAEQETEFKRRFNEKLVKKQADKLTKAIQILKTQTFKLYIPEIVKQASQNEIRKWKQDFQVKLKTKQQSWNEELLVKQANIKSELDQQKKINHSAIKQQAWKSASYNLQEYFQKHFPDISQQKHHQNWKTFNDILRYWNKKHSQIVKDFFATKMLSNEKKATEYIISDIVDIFNSEKLNPKNMSLKIIMLEKFANDLVENWLLEDNQDINKERLQPTQVIKSEKPETCKSLIEQFSNEINTNFFDKMTNFEKNWKQEHGLTTLETERLNEFFILWKSFLIASDEKLPETFKDKETALLAAAQQLNLYLDNSPENDKIDNFKNQFSRFCLINSRISQQFFQLNKQIADKEQQLLAVVTTEKANLAPELAQLTSKIKTIFAETGSELIKPSVVRNQLLENQNQSIVIKKPTQNQHLASIYRQKFETFFEENQPDETWWKALDDKYFMRLENMRKLFSQKFKQQKQLFVDLDQKSIEKKAKPFLRLILDSSKVKYTDQQYQTIMNKLTSICHATNQEIKQTIEQTDIGLDAEYTDKLATINQAYVGKVNKEQTDNEQVISDKINERIQIVQSLFQDYLNNPECQPVTTTKKTDVLLENLASKAISHYQSQLAVLESKIKNEQKNFSSNEEITAMKSDINQKFAPQINEIKAKCELEKNREINNKKHELATEYEQQKLQCENEDKQKSAELGKKITNINQTYKDMIAKIAEEALPVSEKDSCVFEKILEQFTFQTRQQNFQQEQQPALEIATEAMEIY